MPPCLLPIHPGRAHSLLASLSVIGCPWGTRSYLITTTSTSLCPPSLRSHSTPECNIDLAGFAVWTLTHLICPELYILVQFPSFCPLDNWTGMVSTVTSLLKWSHREGSGSCWLYASPLLLGEFLRPRWPSTWYNCNFQSIPFRVTLGHSWNTLIVFTEWSMTLRLCVHILSTTLCWCACFCFCFYLILSIRLNTITIIYLQ